MCTLDPGCNIPTLSHLIKYLYSKSLIRAMSLNEEQNCTLLS